MENCINKECEKWEKAQKNNCDILYNVRYCKKVILLKEKEAHSSVSSSAGVRRTTLINGGDDEYS